ncbi:putative ribonuclease H-like domain-containing protein [Tanacetum coccineum]
MVNIVNILFVGTRNGMVNIVLLFTAWFHMDNKDTVGTIRTRKAKEGKPQHDDKGFVDSGCSRHMTGNIAYLSDFKEFDGGYVAFGGGAYGGRITGKGTLKTDNLDFEDVYFVNDCDENQTLLKIPRKDNMYSFDMKNIVPKESLTCLIAKATLDESMLWHRRLGHINFKNINKLVKDNLVRGLPTKCFENDQTSVACLKGKQHRASYDFCREKGIKREYSIAWTPQQNGVAERRNRTLIDSKLPTTFWAKAVSTACYVQNRVLVVKPHNKTPYELFRGFKPALSFMRPFGCHVTILNTLDSLGKFDGKSNEDFVVGYSLSSKAFRVHRRKSVRCIVMLIWKDTSYFDSPKMDVENGEPKTADDAQKQVEDGPNNKNVELDKFEDDNSTKDVNDAGQHVNTTSPDVNTGSLKLNVVGPSVNTASSNEQDSTKGEPEVDLGNITNSCIVPTTPNTRNHKDHPIDNVIGEVKSTVQTRRMTKPTSEQGFLSDVWILVDLPSGKRAIGTKWVFRNKKDERGIVIRNKARLVAQGHREEEGLQVQQKEDGIFISQDKYVTEILKKFNSSDVKSASTPIDLEKPLVKDGDADDVDVHLYRSMIGSLMYLTASRQISVCSSAMDSLFELVAYTDSDYVGATQDRKSTTGGCQFLGNRQVLWIQNQLLDYGYNFMNTVINIDNYSTICIIENPVQHSKTKHIEIRHHFIRDGNTKKLIQMVKIQTDYSVADLLTKGFDAGRFQYLVSSIGILNP